MSNNYRIKVKVELILEDILYDVESIEELKDHVRYSLDNLYIDYVSSGDFTVDEVKIDKDYLEVINENDYTLVYKTNEYASKEWNEGVMN